MHRYVRLCAAALLVALLTGCTDRSPTEAASILPRSDVTHASIDTSATGAIEVDVQLSRPGMVEARWWPVGGGDTLSLLANARTGHRTLSLARLYADRSYAYDVRALNGAGEDGAHGEGRFTSPALPPDLARVGFVSTGSSTSPLSMLELTGDFHGYVALDRAGTPVWWWRSQGAPQGWARRANGNFVFNDAGFGLFEVAPDGRTVHALDATLAPTLAPFIHHEVLATPDHHILFLALDRRTVADTVLTGDAIWEWTPETGALVKHTSVFDILDPSLDVGTRSSSSDWVHANSLSYGAHGNLILSLNWLNEVVSIAPNFGPVEWRLGGRRSSYAIASDAVFHGQHSVSELGNGHILMFDNGRDLTGPARESRALEIALDNSRKTARRVWSYVPAPAIYAPFVGSARRLGNGNTLVHFGLVPGFRGATGPLSTVEVSRAGEVVWRTVITGIGGLGLSYRNEPLATIAGERTSP